MRSADDVKRIGIADRARSSEDAARRQALKKRNRKLVAALVASAAFVAFDVVTLGGL